MPCESDKANTDQSLAERLDRMTVKAQLVRPDKEDRFQCLACAHRCKIGPGARGLCQMRANRPGADDQLALWAPSGYVAGLAVDPIEKKPLYHFMPGRDALSFGMLGCNFRCDFCQNWMSSQVLKDGASRAFYNEISAQAIVEQAVRGGAPVIASTYNEPVITAEWSHEIFRLSKEKGIKNVYVSNGFATEEALKYLRPVMDGLNVDLKSFQDKNYRQLGGRLQPVLDTIARAWEMGFWVEVVTLVVPGFNSSDEEFRDMAQFIAGVSTDIPWHVSAFFPNYKKTTGDSPTTPQDILRAAHAGREAGLKHIYAGNLRGAIPELENTQCPGCGKTVIDRRGYSVGPIQIDENGQCAHCGETIAGIWK